MSVIAARHVTRRFGPVTAVDDVTLAVAAGEVVGLIGANGAGKTTVIRLLLGLLAPSSGEVTLEGGPPSRERRRRLGYVAQGLGLWPDLTIAEHARLAAAAFGVPAGGLDDVELGRWEDRLVGQLPLGVKRRAAFMLALVHRPTMLLLDEPTSGVDPLARSRLWDLIGGVAGEGSGVLVSTHFLDEAARCDRVVLLSRGRVAAQGTVAELTRARTAVLVRAPQWETAWRVLEAAGAPVLPAGRAVRVTGMPASRVRQILAGLDAEVTEVAATLEEVFLAVAK